MFYQFNTEYKRGAIKIKSIIKYDTLNLLNTESPLKKNNTFKIASGKKWFDLIRFDDSLSFAISGTF